MKLAILSDIHGNLEALEAVLADMEKTRPDQVVSLGDNISYGPDSARVMEILMERDIASILGNHEMAVCHPRFMKWFNPRSQKAVSQAAKSLGTKARDYIRTLPRYRILPNGIRLVHGLPPDSPFLYLYQMDPGALARRIQAMDPLLCFAGHTHDLELFSLSNGELVTQKIKGRTLSLEGNRPCIVNAGAVGQPGDGEPSAKYLILDTQTQALEIRHCPFDFNTTQEKIRAAGIPHTYADKLGIHFRNES